jgi:ABC-type nitrate/sulfonate/bicarbonate transport system substrate-binding protein
VDGSTLREPAITVSEQRDPRIKVVAYGAEMFKDQPGTVVAVSGAFLAKNPEAVQKLVDAIVQATDVIQKDPQKAVPAIEAALGKGISRRPDDPKIARLAGVEIHRRSAGDRRFHARDAGLSGQDRHA